MTPYTIILKKHLLCVWKSVCRAPEQFDLVSSALTYRLLKVYKADDKRSQMQLGPRVTSPSAEIKIQLCEESQSCWWSFLKISQLAEGKEPVIKYM